MRSRHLISFAFAATLSPAIASSENPRPRGVGPEHAKHYKNPSSFTCILNPSTTIDFSQVNDDFCDCPDGSDEPGTSACSNLSPFSPPSIATSDPNLNYTVALPGFYCKNKGHRPGYIPFTYINDGVCDYELCCDGSDEWANVGGVKCEDKCKEIGAEWRKQDESRQKTKSAAAKERKELVSQAKRIRLEIEEKIANYQIMLISDEEKIKNANGELVEIEKQEKLRMVRAPKKGGRLGMLASLTKQRITDLKVTLGKLVAQHHDAEKKVRQLEEILDKFKEEYNPNFNDEGVKRAVRAWEDYDATGRYPVGDYLFEKELEERLGDDSEYGLVWSDFEQEDPDTGALYQLEQYLPQSLRDWVRQKMFDLRVMLVENGILAQIDSDTTESKTLQDARARLTTVTSERDSRQNEINSSEEDLKKDYGPDDIFRALKGQCIIAESGEYNYEHCFMDHTTQKPQKGGMDTNMGNFDRIEFVTVDEEEPADGKGLGSGERIALKYENGAHCWNGPARSTQVILACYETNEIWKVIEAEKCVYRMEGGSPAACFGDAAQPKVASSKQKDEL